MTSALHRYERAGLQVRIARARLLFQIARDDAALADLVSFARVIGVEIAADSLPAFRAAMTAELQIALAELDRLENGYTQASPAAVQSRYGDPERLF